MSTMRELFCEECGSLIGKSWFGGYIHLGRGVADHYASPRLVASPKEGADGR